MEFVQIRSFDNYILAHITLTMLQDSGINCHLQDEYTITIDPLLSPALGGIKLMVAASLLQRARDLIKEAERGD